MRKFRRFLLTVFFPIASAGCSALLSSTGVHPERIAPRGATCAQVERQVGPPLAIVNYPNPRDAAQLAELSQVGRPVLLSGHRDYWLRGKLAEEKDVSNALGPCSSAAAAPKPARFRTR